MRELEGMSTNIHTCRSGLSPSMGRISVRCPLTFQQHDWRESPKQRASTLGWGCMRGFTSIYERSDNEVPGLNNKGALACTWYSCDKTRDKMHHVEVTVNSYSYKRLMYLDVDILPICSTVPLLSMVLPISLQYRGQPFIQYRGQSKTAACCMATLGHILLLVVGAAAELGAMCRAMKVNFAVLLNNKITC